MAREQDGGALRQARKEYARSIRLQRTVNADVASLHDQPVAETVDNARRQQGPTKGVRNGGPHRRGISGDMMRTTACQLERPSTPGGRNPAEETLPITVSGKWKGRRQGVGSGPCRPSTIRSPRDCHPCLRYVRHPCLRARQLIFWYSWVETNHRPPDHSPVSRKSSAVAQGRSQIGNAACIGA